MIAIKKVSYIQERTTIEYSSPERKEKVSIESRDIPLPEFRQAFDAIATDLPPYLPLDEDQVEELVLKGVSLKSENGEYISAIFSVTVYHTISPRPLNFATYLIDLEDEPNLYAHVDVLVKQAKRFIAGERMQADLFGGDEGNSQQEEPQEVEA